METYQRRKYRNTKENQYSKDRDQSRLMSTVAPTLVRHGFATPPPLPLPPPSDCTSPHLSHNTHLQYVDHSIQVAVGSLYEIDHFQLPPRTPAQLRSIRVAMVSEKTHQTLAVRFPSIESLKTYFNISAREMYPELDEKFVMGITLASKVLFRQVPSHEFAEKKHSVDFWLVNSGIVENNACSSNKQGCLLSALKCNGMVRWGTRRQVKFLEKHKEKVSEPNDLASTVVEDENMEGIEDEDEEEEEEEEESETDDIDFAEKKQVAEDDINGNMMRKSYMLRENSRRKKAKKIKCEIKKKHKKKKPQAQRTSNKCRELVVFQNPKDRWSTERYKLATKNLLEVMKDKGATASSPIIRPDLRAEARKKIGDTGLLDQLLKHMAGKLAPDGENRFRRRHNADGALEYWLEDAELVDIRKKAGVNDPYWTPPPGWKPGDSPTQDPVCAKELRQLKEEILDLKRMSQEMVPRKLFDEELAKLKRENEALASSKMEKKVAEVLPDPVSISQKLDQLANSLVPSESHIAKEPALQIYAQQLVVLSDLAKGIETRAKNMKEILQKQSKLDEDIGLSCQLGEQRKDFQTRFEELQSSFQSSLQSFIQTQMESIGVLLQSALKTHGKSTQTIQQTPTVHPPFISTSSNAGDGLLPTPFQYTQHTQHTQQHIQPHNIQPQNTKIRGILKKKPISILIDTGASHTFLDKRLAIELGFIPEPITPMTITVANGNQIVSDSHCPNLSWTMHDLKFHHDPRVIKLTGCDMVLGVDWMSTYNPMLFDFKRMEVSFQKDDGQQVRLRSSFGEVAYGCLHMMYSEEEDPCPICLESMLNKFKSTIRGCMHTFCTSCILRWASYRVILCPLCRTPFEFIFSVHLGDNFEFSPEQWELFWLLENLGLLLGDFVNEDGLPLELQVAMASQIEMAGYAHVIADEADAHVIADEASDSDSSDSDSSDSDSSESEESGSD